MLVADWWRLYPPVWCGSLASWLTGACVMFYRCRGDLVSELILCYDRCNVSKRTGKALEVMSPDEFIRSREG